ncbi:MAG: Uma2 family endonuclease [Selenomonas sp.]|nr:Uma2 family endonuclease [Selenomonas sp.]
MEQLKEYADRKYEMENGKVVMLAAASIPHLRIQRKLSRIIDTFLQGKRCEVFTEAKILFEDRKFYYPDLLIVCDPSKVKLNHIEGAPDFVVEILSPTTAKRDLSIKKDTYEKHGVKEYWIIDPKSENITVYQLKDGKYELDEVYHNYTEEEWEGLDEEEQAQEKLKESIKVSLYDDLIIPVKDIFADLAR